MNKDQQFEVLMQRLDRFEEKLDKVRTEDLPQVKSDVAQLVRDSSRTSKFYSGTAGALALILSIFVDKWTR